MDYLLFVDDILLMVIYYFLQLLNSHQIFFVGLLQGLHLVLQLLLNSIIMFILCDVICLNLFFIAYFAPVAIAGLRIWTLNVFIVFLFICLNLCFSLITPQEALFSLASLDTPVILFFVVGRAVRSLPINGGHFLWVSRHPVDARYLYVFTLLPLSEQLVVFLVLQLVVETLILLVQILDPPLKLIFNDFNCLLLRLYLFVFTFHLFPHVLQRLL